MINKDTHIDLVRYTAKKFRENAENARKEGGEYEFYSCTLRRDRELMKMVYCLSKELNMDEYYGLLNEVHEITYGPMQ